MDSAEYLLNSLVDSGATNFQYSINYYFHLVEKRRDNYKAAYEYKEICESLLDSISNNRRIIELATITQLYNIDREVEKVKNSYWIKILSN